MRSPHYLAPLRTDRIPAYHIAFDCETKAAKKHGRYAHRWVCGAAATGELSAAGEWGYDSPRAFATPHDLWEYITGEHPHGAALIVWAHNLAFDLRVSEALRWLPEFGYALEAIVLEKTAAWASFTSAQGDITVCDLHSWLPVPLAKVASAVGRPRGKVTYATATEAQLIQHCLADTLITIEAVGRVVEWLSLNEGGSFRPTGSGQSHAMWRRRWLPEKTVLVHGDEVALERERVAMWTGRAEAWQWGKVTGPLYEHDLNLAYCRIAATSEVPVKLIQRTGKVPVAHVTNLSNSYAILADVTVTTGVPVVPTSEDGRVFWPVGTFQTTLWDPEIRSLVESGAEVEIHRTWRYAKAPVLAKMANYIIDLLSVERRGPDKVIQLMLKHWARTLVGRCALRYREWDDYGTVGTMGLSLSTMFDEDTGDMTELLQVGKRVMELAALAESDSSVPQITGWVMSKARANLWAIMCAAGLDNLAYVDTDCVIVTGEGNARLLDSRAPDDALVLVPKATYTKAQIYGPRNLTLEGERRISGVPKRAVRTGELSFNGEVWAGLRSSLENKRPSEVTILPRTFDVDDTDPRRDHQPGGITAAYRLGTNA